MRIGLSAKENSEEILRKVEEYEKQQAHYVRRKSRAVVVKMSPAQYDKLERAAKERKVSISAMVRMSVEHELKKGE